ncbi:glycosyltransferase family 4 protein [Clostridium perfringens]|uniref:glycosyltransferase family 4 protein n=1 Tax=Clostridium perfringens TaxID=1502 RepID=UPI0024BC9746|nr:glycosyltransferase family 4 protein [Clostridium perfringens]
MKKVLFLTTRSIYPVNDGRKVVLYNYCKGLVEKHNCEVRLFVIEDENELGTKPDFISNIYSVNTPNKFEKMKNLLIKSTFFKWPLQVSLYYSKKIKENLEEVLEEYNPDIIICDMVRTSEYAKNLDCLKYKKILDMDDILSKRYRRQAENGSLNINAIGAYQSKLPKFINNILSMKFIMKYILEKEANLLSEYEIRIASYYDSIIFVSEIEKKEFNKKLGKKKSEDITIGVDYKFFSERKCSEKKEFYIGFLGNMYVAHNKDAVSKFINDIFPKILNVIPGAKFRIIGKCPKEYKEALSTFNIELTGEVDDIRKYVQECSVMVAPLIYGSGIKTKILETMAMGVPVVTNSIGAEGINAKNGVDFYVEDDDTSFSQKIILLMKDKKLNNEMANNGKKFVLSNHLWDDILEKFKCLL